MSYSLLLGPELGGTQSNTSTMLRRLSRERAVLRLRRLGLDFRMPIARQDPGKAVRVPPLTSIPNAHAHDMSRSLTIRSGQRHPHRYMRPLLTLIENEVIDPTTVITHRMALADAAHGYDILLDEKDGCAKVVLKS